MQLVHLSDTHLGYSAYNKTDPSTGFNQREIDVYSAFNEIIEYILKTKPDLVIHAGDLFDSVRPSNRAIHEAFRQLVRLSRAEIPTVIISGNHSTPRQRTTGSIFHLLEFLEHIYPVFEGKYKTLEIRNVKIHAIPHPYSEEMFEESFRKLKVDNKFSYNILVTHATVIGITGFAGAEFKELSIPPSVLSNKFDYIALGHLHKFIKVADNAYYSGSPERLGFAESGYKKGFLDVTLDNIQVKHIRTNAREMIDIKPIDCSKLDATQVMREVKSSIPADISGKIIRLVFQDIPHHVYSSLNFKKIDEITSDALHCDKQFVKKSTTGNAVEASSIGALGEEFMSFLTNQKINKNLQRKLQKKGLEYLEDALQAAEED